MSRSKPICRLYSDVETGELWEVSSLFGRMNALVLDKRNMCFLFVLFLDLFRLCVEAVGLHTIANQGAFMYENGTNLKLAVILSLFCP